MLKKISSLARQDMEKFMGTKVYLETWVKVKENWRDQRELRAVFRLPGRIRRKRAVSGIPQAAVRGVRI